MKKAQILLITAKQSLKSTFRPLASSNTITSKIPQPVKELTADPKRTKFPIGKTVGTMATIKIANCSFSYGLGLDESFIKESDLSARL